MIEAKPASIVSSVSPHDSVLSPHRSRLSTNGSALRSVVELVGLAGAGKSSLARRLSESDPRFVIAPDLQARRYRDAATLLSHAPGVASVCIRRLLAGDSVSWEQMKFIGYVLGWSPVLHRCLDRASRSYPNVCLLLDHGPLFKLATLLTLGFHQQRRSSAEAWWQHQVGRWSTHLNTVIWIDACDEDLIERIRGRKQRHAIKAKSMAEGIEYLHRYREAYQAVMEILQRSGTTRIMRMDSSRQSLDEMQRECRDACFHSYQ